MLGDLPLAIEGYSLERLEQRVSSEFTRVTTVVHLHGGGEEGVGEDVTYAARTSRRFQDAGPAHDSAARPHSASSRELVGGLDLFPAPPHSPAYRLYRRWAFESAALDLALRQAGVSLARAPRARGAARALRRLDAARRARRRSSRFCARLAQYPWLEFKLDATSSWTDELVAELAATGAVESIDLKGRYSGTTVDQGATPRSTGASSRASRTRGSRTRR